MSVEGIKVLYIYIYVCVCVCVLLLLFVAWGWCCSIKFVVSRIRLDWSSFER